MEFDLQTMINDSVAKHDKTGIGNVANPTNSSMSPNSAVATTNTAPVEQLSSAASASFPETPRNTTTNVADELTGITAQVQTIQAALDARKEQETIDSLPGKIIELTQKDTSEEKQQIRADAQLSEKEAMARAAGERIIERDNYYRDEIERLEKNPDGMLKGALNAKINEVERMRSREMADLSFSYQVANSDYQAAAAIVDQRIADMEADIQNDIDAFTLAYQFAQDDMTEKEKLEAQQKFQKEMQDRELAYDKEIANYRHNLFLAEAQFKADLAAEEVVGTTDNTNQIQFLRDTVANIVGTDENPGLYKGAGVSGIGKFLGDKFKGDTKYRRLETQVDTLRSNMLTLATNPDIKKFFGPQMSDADVRLMTAAGTTLRPGSQSPEELKAEALRIDDLLNRMQTAVALGEAAGSGNYITAPDGQLIEIID